MEEQQHLDHEALAELQEVMEEDFEVLLGTYLSDSRMRIETLKAALAEGDAEHYAKTAHSLKGSCINIGALKLGNCCTLAENAGRSGDLSKGEAEIAAIESEFAIVAEQLSAYLKN